MSTLHGVRVYTNYKEKIVGTVVDGPHLMPEHGMRGTLGHSLPHYFYHVLIPHGGLAKVNAADICIVCANEVLP
jgi:hypothetical protein